MKIKNKKEDKENKMGIKINNIIATAFKPWNNVNEESGFSLTTIWLKPGRKSIVSTT
jgi:hypothetical protein